MFVRAKILGVLTGLAALTGCASVAPPTGGPRDVTAPRRIGSSPDSAARNVSQQFVRLLFSEAVQTKELSKNLLITPQLSPDNPYKLREERNAITLLFDKPLDANTTYSFNFREAVVDITESLPAKNATLSFSTGAVLDSGRVRGHLTELLSAAPVADAAVGLYRTGRDTAGVRRAQPYYLTRTDKNGDFRLGFLKAGTYNLYAVADKNTNGRFDDGERIAYLPAPITIDSAERTVPLVLTLPDRRPPLLTTQEPAATRLRLNFNEGIASVRLTPLTGATPAATEAVQIDRRGRTVTLFKTPATPDGRYLLVATDSTGNASAPDTLNVRFPVPTATSRKTTPEVLYQVETPGREVYRQGLVKFRFAVPVLLIAGQPIGTLIEDSIKRRPLRLPTDGSLSPDRTLLTLRLDTKAKTRIEIRLDSTAVRAITGESLRLPPLRLAPTDAAPTGMVSGKISTKETSFELQLLDDKLQVISTLTSPKGTYKFDNLAPGAYRLRVLIDADHDGRFRNGDPLLRLPAEPVVLLPKPLQVRANWEIEEAITF